MFYFVIIVKMKTVIIYKTNTGFTYDYVELLKPRIECEKDVKINKFKKKEIGWKLSQIDKQRISKYKK